MEIWIFGAGGHAKVVIDAMRRLDIEPQGAFEKYPNHNKSILNVRISKTPQKVWYQTKERYAHIAIGNSQIRQNIQSSLPNVNWINIHHPRAYISQYSQIEAGCFVGAEAVIQPDANIGHHTIINTGAIIEHDCTIGSFSHIAPRATLGGGVKIGKACHIGLGASVREGITIGNNAHIAMGSVVVKDIPDNTHVKGIPAKPRQLTESVKSLS